MTKTAIRLLTLAMFATATATMPMINAAKAAGGESPSPSTDTSSTTKEKKKKHNKSSSIDDPRFLQDYRAAYATIYDRHDYSSAIAQLVSSIVSPPRASFWTK